jgi:hypothetical protein
MKKERFSVEQIVAVVKQAELGVPVAEVIRKVADADTRDRTEQGALQVS